MSFSNEWDFRWGFPEVLPSGKALIDASGKPLEYFLERICAGDYGDYGKYDPENTTPAMTEDELSQILKDFFESNSGVNGLYASTPNFPRHSQAKQQNSCHLKRLAGSRFSAVFPVDGLLLYFSINEHGRTLVCNYLDR